MDEPEQPPPHAGELLTREDVERLIEEHGGPEGLDLREADLREAHLSQLDLQKANFRAANLEGAYLQRSNLREVNLQEANLSGANLQEAHLWNANLERSHLMAAYLSRTILDGANVQGADLRHANLEGASLSLTQLQRAALSHADLGGAFLGETDLQGADLSAANLQGARLRGADLRTATLVRANLQGTDVRWSDLRRARLAGASLQGSDLEGANWGDYVLGDEIDGDFGRVASVYRALKQWHTDAGMYDIAGEFHYREMEARRKLAQKERRVPAILGLNLLRLLYGHGERPERVIGWAAAVVFGLALVHWGFGTVAGGFLDALYYSAVSFTALGYGASDSDPHGWAGRFLGAGESFLGVFMMALFLVTFTRKMTR